MYSILQGLNILSTKLTIYFFKFYKSIKKFNTTDSSLLKIKN